VPAATQQQAMLGLTSPCIQLHNLFETSARAETER
jgi:hypothetical protein